MTATSEPAPESPPARYRRAASALWRGTGQGVLILPEGAKEPLAVGGAGRELWDMLDVPRTIDEAAAELAGRYGLNAQDVEEGIAQVFQHLGSLGALDVVER